MAESRQPLMRPAGSAQSGLAECKAASWSEAGSVLGGQMLHTAVLRELHVSFVFPTTVAFLIKVHSCWAMLPPPNSPTLLTFIFPQQAKLSGQGSIDAVLSLFVLMHTAGCWLGVQSFPLCPAGSLSFSVTPKAEE